MIRIVQDDIKKEADKIISRSAFTIFREEEAVVRDILQDVADNGDPALLKYTNRFDKTSFFEASQLRLTDEELMASLTKTEAGIRYIIRDAVRNIEAHHKRQLQQSWEQEKDKGAVTGIRVTPLESVGVYVPGGTASYPSSVLMNVVPARVAGVKRIVMVTPPRADGMVDPYVLAAAHELGVNEVYRIGGAQAVGALAFGTQTIPRVDKIVGPGNIWVTLAKKMVFGIVGIDKLAGPSEIMILADENAPVSYIAADMLGQAEHDPLASSIAVVFSLKQAEAVNQELAVQIEKLPRRNIAQQSLRNFGAVFVVKSFEEMIELANHFAPEHLEIMFETPDLVLPGIRNAGAIFCGYYSPEALGDYYAGANHVLPTGGTARFASPLGVDDFTKKSSIIRYNKEASLRVADDVVAFARVEGLDAHAGSMEIRKN